MFHRMRHSSLNVADNCIISKHAIIIYNFKAVLATSRSMIERLTSTINRRRTSNRVMNTKNRACSSVEEKKSFSVSRLSPTRISSRIRWEEPQQEYQKRIRLFRKHLFARSTLQYLFSIQISSQERPVTRRDQSQRRQLFLRLFGQRKRGCHLAAE